MARVRFLYFRNLLSGSACIISIFAMLFAYPCKMWAQPMSVSLSEALEIAARHYPLLKRDVQFVEQQKALIASAIPQARTEVFLAGQQLDANTGNGINGLGFSQDFNLPSAKKRYAEAAEQRVLLGSAQQELTRMELDKAVAKAYFELLYAQDLVALARTQAQLMDELVELANLRFELGETGKIPVLSAMGKEKEALLALQQARHNIEIAHTIFNNWLYTDTLYTITGNSLPPASGYVNWFVNGGHPTLLYQQQRVNLAESAIQAERAALKPQVTTGLQMQMIDADLPFYAYHLGMKVPLSQKAIRSRIEGAKLGVELEKTALETAREALENKRRHLIAAIKKEQETLDFYNKELLPLAEEQIEASRKAYSQGAVVYIDYLQNLEQALGSRRQYLDTLRSYHLLRLELEFLSGRR
jgi:outer membrane protein TolC